MWDKKIILFMFLIVAFICLAFGALLLYAATKIKNFNIMFAVDMFGILFCLAAVGFTVGWIWSLFFPV